MHTHIKGVERDEKIMAKCEFTFYQYRLVMVLLWMPAFFLFVLIFAHSLTFNFFGDFA